MPLRPQPGFLGRSEVFPPVLKSNAPVKQLSCRSRQSCWYADLRLCVTYSEEAGEPGTYKSGRMSERKKVRERARQVGREMERREERSDGERERKGKEGRRKERKKSNQGENTWPGASRGWRRWGGSIGPLLHTREKGERKRERESQMKTNVSQHTASQHTFAKRALALPNDGHSFSACH